MYFKHKDYLTTLVKNGPITLSLEQLKLKMNVFSAK